MDGLSVLKGNDPECSVLRFWHKAPKGIAPIGLLAFLQRLGHHPQDPGSLDTWMLAQPRNLAFIFRTKRKP
jgi:hypothetical protein